MVTGSEDTSIQVQYGEVKICPGMTTQHEEADVIMVTQMMFAVNKDKKKQYLDYMWWHWCLSSVDTSLFSIWYIM